MCDEQLVNDDHGCSTGPAEQQGGGMPEIDREFARQASEVGEAPSFEERSSSSQETRPMSVKEAKRVVALIKHHIHGRGGNSFNEAFLVDYDTVIICATVYILLGYSDEQIIAIVEEAAVLAADGVDADGQPAFEEGKQYDIPAVMLELLEDDLCPLSEENANDSTD